MEVASFNLPEMHSYEGKCGSKMILFWITWKPGYVLNMTFVEVSVTP